MSADAGIVPSMARLKSTDRAKLPDSAFAYIDSKGRRRLPVNDEAHVRAALGRFERVAFEDDASRERARARLLNAAKRFGIVPVGFITGQLEAERAFARHDSPRPLPSGFVTMLLTDIEGSTALLDHLGDGYGDLLNDVRTILRKTAEGMAGCVVETRADEFFAAFESPGSALDAAVTVQRQLSDRQWPAAVQVRVRI